MRVLASISVFIQLSVEWYTSKQFLVLCNNKRLVLDAVHNSHRRLYVKPTTSTSTNMTCTRSGMSNGMSRQQLMYQLVNA